MKKLKAILQECEIADKLFGLREKQIKTVLAAARNDIEEQGTQAEIEYENLCKKLGAKGDIDYKDVLNDMIECMDTIEQSKNTAKILDLIEKDLDSEVEVAKK